MAKKERVQIETYPVGYPELVPEDEPIYEAEAYGSPQPDAGSDVTVMKTVGVGGPVPIVAPKHNTVQLQPIVVPLAVVPYMTQDSSVLRTDGRTQTPYYSAQEEGEATEFKAVEKEKAKKKQRPMVRLFAFISFLLAAVATAPYILSYFMQDISGVSIAEFNSIGLIEGWINGEAFSFYPISHILMLAVMALTMLTTLILFIGLLIGKYPKPISGILVFAAIACMAADLINDIVKDRFAIADRIIFIVVLAVLVVLFVLSIVFAVLINRMEDKAEQLESEI